MNANPTQKRAWTILIVDDEADIRRFLATMIERQIPGARTLTAENGKQGLERLAHETVDLIVSDHRMPEMEGTEFLTLAAQMAPDVPRILLTGFADADIAVRAVNAGHVSGFFQKPARAEELVAEIARLLQARQAEVQRQQAFARTMDLARRRATAPHPGGPGSAPTKEDDA